MSINIDLFGKNKLGFFDNKTLQSQKIGEIQVVRFFPSTKNCVMRRPGVVDLDLKKKS